MSYLTLAAAIIESGIKTNDTAFLNSGWYKFLKLAIAIRVERLSKDKSGISLEHTGGKRET